MYRTIFIFLAVILTINGCTENKIEIPRKLDGTELHYLVIKAANGNKVANDSLSSLINLDSKNKNQFNSLAVDSFYLQNVKYFSVLMEYPNPIFNYFAIYDEFTNCYLIDKSLNGKLTFEMINVSELNFLKVTEQFISKDTLQLVRLSLYQKFDESFKLVYRSFAELRTPGYQFNQTIVSVSSDTIKTKILFPKRYKSKFNEDVFIFDSANQIYKSNQSLFDSLVYKEVAEFDINIQKPTLN